MRISTVSGVTIKVEKDDPQTVRRQRLGNDVCISVIVIEGIWSVTTIRNYNDGRTVVTCLPDSSAVGLCRATTGTGSLIVEGPNFV